MRKILRIAWMLALFCGAALAQAGTNAAVGQQETKPGTGRAGEVITSPNVNNYISGNVGYTSGSPGDVTSYNSPATAGAVSSGAESTAMVSTRAELERQAAENLAVLQGARGAQMVSDERHAPPPAFNAGGGSAGSGAAKPEVSGKSESGSQTGSQTHPEKSQQPPLR